MIAKFINNKKIGKYGNSSVHFDRDDTECKIAKECERCSVQSSISIDVSPIISGGDIPQYGIPSTKQRILCGKSHITDGCCHSGFRLHLFVGEKFRQQIQQHTNSHILSYGGHCGHSHLCI